MDCSRLSFELVKQIGSGQFSEVYKAKWLNAPLTPPCPPSPGVQSSLMDTFNDAYPAANQLQLPLPPLSPGAPPNHHHHRHQTSEIQPDNNQLMGTAFSFDRALMDEKPNFQMNGIAHQQAGQRLRQQQQTDVVYGERYVALKKIKFYDIQNSQQRMDCMKEIRLLQQLNHPNIINYMTYFEVRHELYIVLELADGGDIGKLIRYFQKRNKLINEQTILKYFTQICSAVRYIHSKRILHRDIKPANIFMTSDGVVKLGDFGLGRFFSQNTRDAHTLVGTFYYMSPERISGHGYDFSSDIWSVGCVLYELITLYSPFDITNAPPEALTPSPQHSPMNNNNNPYNLQWLCDRIMRADYPSLDDYNQVSVRLRQLATECLSMHPDLRPDMGYICQIVGEVQRTLLDAAQAISSDRIMHRPAVLNPNQRELR